MECYDNFSTKAQIVDRAVSLFQTLSYDHVTVQDICDACDLSRSAFYYHFGTKEEILDYYFITVNQGDISSILDDEELDSLDKFYLIFEIYLDRTIAATPRVFSQILKRSLSRQRSIFDPKHTPMREIYTDLLKRAQEENLIGNRSNPEKLVNAIVYLADGIAYVWAMSDGELDLIDEHKYAFQSLLLT